MRWTAWLVASGWLCAMSSCGGAPPRPGPPPAATASSAAPSAAPSKPPPANAAKAPEKKTEGHRSGQAADDPKKEPDTLPCAPGSPAHDGARRAFQQLDQQIEQLAPEADPAPANRALAALLKNACFRIGELERSGSLEADSALALKTFWQQGGRWWIDHHLELGAEPTPDQPLESVVPPVMRRTLTKESHPRHPLGDLLCSVTQPDCGQQTRGWQRRAEQAMRLFVEKERWRWTVDVTDPEPPKTEQRCSELAKKVPPAKRYTEWRACVGELPLAVAAFPLGGSKVPREGWLVLRGRRGHYSFCDEIRVYDLSAGAAYVVQSCSGLALRDTGRVDHQKTDAGRKPAAQKGYLPLDNLREAAWMILFSDELDTPGVRNAQGFPIPKHVPVRRPAGLLPKMVGSAFGMSSAQTRLTWSYVKGNRVLKNGTLTWPSDYNDAGKDHAVALLRIAEDGFVEGCPPTRLPAKVNLGKSHPGVSHIDASRQSLRQAHQELVQALDELRKGRICRQRAR